MKQTLQYCQMQKANKLDGSGKKAILIFQLRLAQVLPLTIVGKTFESATLKYIVPSKNQMKYPELQREK